MKGQSNYDKTPCVEVKAYAGSCRQGWEAIGAFLREATERLNKTNIVVAVDCYVGVFEEEVLDSLRKELRPEKTLWTRGLFLPPAEIDRLVEPFLGGEDPLFGRLTGLTLPRFFDTGKIEDAVRELGSAPDGIRLVVGCGAGLLGQPDVLVFADMPRREGQLRQRRNEVSNLGAVNSWESAGLQYKRSYFVDWRVCDRWKKSLLGRIDFLLDTTEKDDPRIIEGQAFRAALEQTVRRPFRVVPFFDPAPWGGQWLKEVCGLPENDVGNYGWCFDCVPEENSLLIQFGKVRVEVPSVNLVFDQPIALLGQAVYERFGDEFPIRFDMLDTMGGGNLSLQLHPLTSYIQNRFGMYYTQDESYYLLDVGEGASVYLGVNEEVEPSKMMGALEAANREGSTFDDTVYISRWCARKHDHFLIPAGTVHCSGSNCLVLEISATPYIFTFKLWDWRRLGLDGKPRPISLEHGLKNICWERNTSWIRCNLINRIRRVNEGDGWVEERTGLHELEFIETRRHWFTEPVSHERTGGVEVLNLVEGKEAVVQSPEDCFEPLVVHYAETFILPHAAGPYRIVPLSKRETDNLATIKAFVRI